MEFLLGTFVSYLISLTVNEHTDVIHKRREKKLATALMSDSKLIRALKSKRTLRDELRIACVHLAQDKDKLGVKPHEKPLWQLLSNEIFQDDLCEWMMAGAIPEGEAVKARILAQIENALAAQNLPVHKIEFLQQGFFEQLEKSIFSNDILARWRHQQSLEYLRGQVSTLRQRADEAAGIFSDNKQKAALDRYCDEALKVWDIIDLSNLPEGEVDLATLNLLVRQLYMPLRITIEHSKGEKETDAALNKLESQRDARRRREAGHSFEDGDDENTRKAGIGECLQSNKHLVVLGDPGGGKTTMLRWLATAMLLRYSDDPAFSQLPDVETLPEQQWIPVLIRCRDLGADDLCRCFSDFLSQHLLKTTLLPDEAKIMQALILDRIANNQVLLMVDGLDEITDPKVRVSFCQEIERTAARYPQTSIIVTSRIVGYRDMPYRMGQNFQHGIISELDREHKDLFAKRWIEVTEQRQTPYERAKRERELVEALHASDRIERLTGNPMLLTTLALVKRKVGKLPSRRNKLYAEAVAVLLNWNPGYYAPIDDSEAIPQLEYLAYEMCRRGVQRLTDDEIMELLEQFRREYPAVRAAKNHSEREFLALLEARSSILIKAGSIWKKGQQREQAAWEFRHLTFQEYLAAQALIDGRYSNRDKSLSLANQVAPLAGIVRHSETPDPIRNDDSEVSDSWREALRLLVADCKDDDVDDVLRAILTPRVAEDRAVTQRTRAVLATLCLADEPNAGEGIVETILCQLVDSMRVEDGSAHSETSLSRAAMELSRSQWSETLKTHLIQKFLDLPETTGDHFGSLWGSVSIYSWDSTKESQAANLRFLVTALKSEDRIDATAAALTVMNAAFHRKIELVDGLIDALFQLLRRGAAERNAAAWALGWLNVPRADKNATPYWRPDENSVGVLCEQLSSTSTDDIDTQFWILRMLGNSENQKAVEYILPLIEAKHERPRIAAIEALGTIRDKQTIPALSKLLSGRDDNTVSAAAQALSLLGDSSGKALVVKAWHKRDRPFPFSTISKTVLASENDLVNKRLLSQDIDGALPLILPREPITKERVLACSLKLGLAEDEIRQRYETIASAYKLTIGW